MINARFSQTAKAFFPIVVNPAGRAIDVSEVQRWKAPSPIVVTPSGKVTETSEAQ